MAAEAYCRLTPRQAWSETSSACFSFPAASGSEMSGREAAASSPQFASCKLSVACGAPFASKHVDGKSPRAVWLTLVVKQGTDDAGVWLVGFATSSGWQLELDSVDLCLASRRTLINVPSCNRGSRLSSASNCVKHTWISCLATCDA